MTGAPSFLETWIDSEFWKCGAFLASEDGERVTLAKGLSVTRVEAFAATSVPVFYLKDFYHNHFLAFTPKSFVTISRAEILSWIPHLSEQHPPISPISNDDDLYDKDFQLLKNSFNEKLKKVVLISRETYYPFEGEQSVRRLFKKAFQFGTGTPYGIWYPGYGVIGSTPEILFSVKDHILSTFALAGTAKKGEEETLLNSQKDRHEHDLVITDIVEKLTPFCKDIHRMETGIHPYKSLVHLRTNISAHLKGTVSWSELIAALSPTAALGGYPKNLSLNFLAQTNYARKYDRLFGSAFGIISHDTQHVVVSIRNVQWQEGHLFIESGGGIVPESELRKEKEEFRMKRNTIRNHYL